MPNRTLRTSHGVEYSIEAADESTLAEIEKKLRKMDDILWSVKKIQDELKVVADVAQPTVNSWPETTSREQRVSMHVAYGLTVDILRSVGK